MIATRRLLLSLLVLLTLTACNTEGLNSFSASGDSLLLRHNEGVYVVGANGEQQVYLGRDVNPVTVPVLSHDGSTVYYVDRFAGRVMAMPADASTPAVRLTRERASGTSSILSVLPSGDVLFMDRREGQRTWFLQVIDPATTQTLTQIEDIETVFVNAGALDIQPDSADTEFLIPRIVPNQMQLVFLGKELLFHYTIDDSGLAYVDVLPRTVPLNGPVSNLLRARPANDARGALLTEDGRRLVLRTRTGIGTDATWDLYAIDLESDADPVVLASDLSEPPEYAIAPTTQMVVFSVPGTPTVMFSYDFATGDLAALGVGKYQPEWWH